MKIRIPNHINHLQSSHLIGCWLADKFVNLIWEVCTNILRFLNYFFPVKKQSLFALWHNEPFSSLNIITLLIRNHLCFHPLSYRSCFRHENLGCMVFYSTVDIPWLFFSAFNVSSKKIKFPKNADDILKRKIPYTPNNLPFSSKNVFHIEAHTVCFNWAIIW